MYKEIIERKKLPIATFLITLLCAFIYLYKFISIWITGDAGVMDDVLGLGIFICMATISIGEIYRSCIRYKYSIIADQFIIHKMVRNNNIEEESVKFKDIKFLGKVKDLKEDYKVNSTKKYLCSVFKTNRYCCVYSNGRELKKFYFEPSKEMIGKLRFMMNKDECKAYMRNRVSISI
ncbi:hypothetical protein [Haloimpatiens massiliensis]|uniref:hypothetical protein n=1 Tax=Haloimpatiens massiliensis TaxID=1658110 RepID=UPI000C836D55|nr:hypothetical protein [Haloimpatiens massiliensis]